MGIGAIGNSYFNTGIRFGTAQAADPVQERQERERKDQLGIEKTPVEKAKMTPAEKDKEHERKERLGIDDKEETLAEKRANCETCKRRK
ncbi:MAG: hypothetical protein IJ555_09230, partial [Ruminococcus sp.]|nr:hypothetical protein [Ruminococcus sp.]